MATRSLRSHIVRSLMCGLGFFAVIAAYLIASGHDGVQPAPEAPLGGWVGHNDVEWEVNGNEWSPKIAAMFPDCHPIRPGTLTPTVVVIFESGHVKAIPTDDAFGLLGGPLDNEFWVVGQCD